MSVSSQIGRSSPGVPLPDSLGGGCEILWEDGERIFFRGWRLGEDGGWRAVLAVMPLDPHPSPLTLDRLVHEVELKDEIDRPWAVRPLEILRDGGRTMPARRSRRGPVRELS